MGRFHFSPASVAWECSLASKCPGSGTEMIPGEHSNARIKPLQNRHTRTGTCFCWEMAVAHDCWNTEVLTSEWMLHWRGERW
jgi:hypothetical protein